MNNADRTYENKLNKIKKDFKSLIRKKMLTHEELIKAAAECYQKINEINFEYRKIFDESAQDNMNAYYIACDIFEEEYYQQEFIGTEDKSAITSEKAKSECAREILEYVIDKKAVKFFILEPHPDDCLGSASTLLYAESRNVKTVVYTITGGDERDGIDLSEIHQSGKVPTKRKTSVIRTRHKKCGLDDLHYDLRYENIHGDKLIDEISYEELVDYYSNACGYPVKDLADCMEEIINDFSKEEADEKYIVLPLGIMHPMHILTAVYGMEAAVRAKFSDNILFYVDHPYDFQLKDTCRVKKVKDYYSGKLGKKLLYVDGTAPCQRDIAEILRYTYGDKYYGQFDGSLEKTVCAFLMSEDCLERLRKYLPIHVNNVLYATFQAKPFLKTGGLGEVAFSYVKALSPFVNKAGIVMPKYKKRMKSFAENTVIGVESWEENKLCIKRVRYSESGEIRITNEKLEKEKVEIQFIDYTEQDFGFPIYIDGKNLMCHIEKYCWNDVLYYLFDIETCFENENVFDYLNVDRDCAAYALAVMESLGNELDFMPTILHCNDNQTALIPFLHKIKYARCFKDLKTIYTIHYYGYKGIYSKEKILKYLGIKDVCDYCLVCRKDKDCLLNAVNAYSQEDIEKLGIPDDKISLVKTGISCADVVTTVSKGYAQTLQNYPDFRGVKIFGIRNGVPTNYWKFSSNKEDIVYCMQTQENWEEAKVRNKIAFQREMGLKENKDIAMFCMVGRLNAIKGIEDIKNIFSQLLELDLQLVIIGDDDKNVGNFTPYADFFRQKMKENNCKGKFFYSQYSEEMEFKTYSAADVLLMPSRDEACGTTQILAMKYGTLPVVSMIDSFRDTVVDYNSVLEEESEYVKKTPDQMDKGVGFFCFRDDCWALLDIIKMICEKLLKDPEKRKKWRKAINSTVTVDFSWYNYSVREYLELYDGIYPTN